MQNIGSLNRSRTLTLKLFIPEERSENLSDRFIPFHKNGDNEQKKNKGAGQPCNEFNPVSGIKGTDNGMYSIEQHE